MFIRQTARWCTCRLLLTVTTGASCCSRLLSTAPCLSGVCGVPERSHVLCSPAITVNLCHSGSASVVCTVRLRTAQVYCCSAAFLLATFHAAAKATSAMLSIASTIRPSVKESSAALRTSNQRFPLFPFQAACHDNVDSTQQHCSASPEVS